MPNNSKIDEYSDLELEEFLNRSELYETEKETILKSNKKSDTYGDAIYLHKINKVKETLRDLQTYVIRFGIFFPTPIKEKFDKVILTLDTARSDHEAWQKNPNTTAQEKSWDNINKVASAQIKKIGDDIHAQLRSHGISAKE